MTLTAPRCPVPRSGCLPAARGPLSAFLLDHLRRPVHDLPAAPPVQDDPLSGEDTQLFLYLCYELHYRGLPGVDERWEWEPTLLAARAAVEAAFESALLDVVAPPGRIFRDVADELRALITSAAGPSLSRYMLERGTLEQFREFALH